MAKKTLTERFIQNTVAERLNKEYYRRKPAYISTEEYTRLKRADVFLAFMRAPKRPYTVVVEAKSRSTIHQLKLKEAPHQVRWAGRGLAIVLIVGLSAALGYQWYFNAVNTLLLLGLFVLGSTVISRLLSRLDLSLLGEISAIDQLGRYPANEKWIAVGEDTFAKPDQYDTLYRQCRKSGLGLIVVTAKGKVQRRVIPEPRHAFNNYLDSYRKSDDILKTISKRADYGPTPPERAKQLRQTLNALLLLALVGLLALLTYEEQVRPVVPDPFADTYADTPAPQEPDATSPNADLGADAGAGEVTEAPGPTETACAALSVERRSFVVVDAILKPARATVRAEELRRAGIRGFRTIPTECLNSWPAPGRWAVYRDTVYAQRPAARRAARAHKERLEARGLRFEYGRAVKVRPR